MTPAMTSAPATETRSAAVKKPFAIDKRYLAPLLITAILLAAQVNFGVLEDYRKTLLAIGVSIVMEIILGYIFNRKIPHLASAYVSGISCGILVRSPEWWPYALAAMLSVTSKYVIRVQGRHLWNPSNFAIACLLLLAPQTVASLSIQWGNYIWPMLIVWTLGAIIVSQFGRLHICAMYVACFVAFAFLRSLGNGHPFFAEVSPITGPMYQLFIFFMITDPKTTTHSRWAQMLVAFLIAATESALRYWAPAPIAVHAPYYALTIMGPTSNFIEIWMNSRAKKATLETALLRSTTEELSPKTA